MVPNTEVPRSLFTDRETTDYQNQIVHQSKESIPTPKSKLGFNKLALNIVHAVEFSRNGRTRTRQPTTAGPTFRATCQPYHHNHHNQTQRPATAAPRKPKPETGQTNKEGEKFNPRLEITESQTRLRGYLARIFTQQPDRSFPLLPDRRGDK